MNNKLISFYLLPLLFAAAGCSSEKVLPVEPIVPEVKLQTVNYLETDELFPNPERGFYRYSISTDSLTERKVRESRNENTTLIFRFYYLKDFRNAPLSNDLLAQVEHDMAVLRKAGGKAVVRFAYSNSGTEPDAPLSMVLQHIEQLRPVLQRNKDVIAVLQAGFIGAWGEWHSSTNGLETDETRKAILDKLLNVLPADRFVQVRKPRYKRTYVGAQEAMSAGMAFDQTRRARIGLHNDCFLSSENDVGTYLNIAEEKKFLHDEGLYTPMGGETCSPRGIDKPGCDKTQQEMAYLRWSYLNRSYYKPTIEQWAAQGCMDEIARKMGYRIVMKEGVFSDRLAPGMDFSLALTLRNVGYAPMFNPRKVELILRSADGHSTYVAPLPNDPRLWQPGQDVKLETKVMLPVDIASGNYRLFLFLPAPEPTLHDRPEFAVRLANHNCWETSTGYNDLGVVLRIDPLPGMSPGTSSLRFVSKP